MARGGPERRFFGDRLGTPPIAGPQMAFDAVGCRGIGADRVLGGPDPAVRARGRAG